MTQFTATLTIRNFDTMQDRAESFTSTKRGAGSWMTRQCNKFGSAFDGVHGENVIATSFGPVE